MTKTSLAAKRFQIVPIHSDSLGAEVVASNAICHGDMNAIMERIADSRSRNDSIKQSALLDQREKVVQSREDKVTAREAAVTSREDALEEREATMSRLLVKEAAGKLDALAARIDELEEGELEVITWPPGHEPELTVDEDPEDPLELPTPSPLPEDEDEDPEQQAEPRNGKMNGHVRTGDQEYPLPTDLLPRAPRQQEEED